MTDHAPCAPATPIECPPAAAQPQREQPDEARAHLHRLARQLIRAQNRRLLIEFLTLRRAMR